MVKPKIDFSPGSQARKEIQMDFQKDHWKPFRTWFFSNFTKEERNNFQQEFYEELTQKNIKISYIYWFIANHVEKFISVIERDFKNPTGETIKQVFPPVYPFSIEKDNEVRHYNTFQKNFENEIIQSTTQHINALVK